MSDVFISYSRKDKVFVERLHHALETQGRDSWIDWQDIPPTADWWQEIERGIEGTNTFVFVISPDSVVSQVCDREINHAVKHNKRLVPIVHREGFEQTHPALGKYNWLFFREPDDFDRGFAQLIEAINTDLEYVRSHTRILERAIEWDKANRNESFVLRGDDLQSAHTWLLAAESKKPFPTVLQREYISASQATEEATEILLKAGQRAKQLVQIGVGILLATLIGAAVAGNWAINTIQEIQNGRRIERASAVALQRFEVDPTDGLLLGMRTGFELQKVVRNKRLENYSAIRPILTLQSGLERIREIRIPANQGRVLRVAFSQDGTQMVTGGDDGSTKLWNKDGSLNRIFQGNKNSILSVAFSPDSLYIATGDGSGNVKLWGKGGSLFRVLQGNQFSIRTITFSPNGNQIAAGSGDGTVRLWNTDGKLLNKIQEGQSAILSVTFSPDGKQVAIGSDDGTVRLWSQDVSISKVLQGHKGNILCVAFSPDANQIATGSNDGTVKLWNTSGKLLKEFQGNQRSVLGITFSPDGKQIVTGGEEGTIRVWRKEGIFVKEIQQSSDNIKAESKAVGYSKHGILSIAFNPKSTELAVGSEDGTTRLWDKDGRFLREFQTINKGGIQKIVFSPDDTQIATSGGGVIRLWSKDGKLLKEFQSNNADGGLDFSPNGTEIVIGSRNGTTKLWSKDGKLLKEFQDEGYVQSVAFSPDGKQIAVGGGTTKIWGRDGKLLKEFQGSKGRVLSLAFSPTREYLAIGDDSNTKLWGSDGTPLKELEGNQHSILDIAFNSEGTQIATSGVDGSIKLWNNDGDQIGQFEGGSPSAISPDWKTVAIVETPLDSEDKVVRLYQVDLDLDSLLSRTCQHLKPYLLYTQELKEDRDRCAAHLGRNWGEK